MIIWNKVITSMQYQVLIELSKENVKLYSCITMIIYNCIIHNEQCLIELLSEKNKSIISSLLINSINENNLRESDYNDFIFLIIKYILSKNKTAKMIFELLFKIENKKEEKKAIEDFKFEILINKEQLIFLEFFHTLILEGNYDFKPEEYDDDIVYEKMYNILYILCDFLCNNNPKGNKYF